MIGATDRLISSQIDKLITKPRGKVFFVDGSAGDNYNDGLSPYSPKLTLTAGVALLTSGADDVLFVVNYGAAGKDAEPLWPIAISPDRCHILGLQSMVNSKWPTIQANDDNHALDITGSRIEVANLEVGGGATKAAIHVGSGAGIWGAYLHDLWFGFTGDTTCQDGVYVAAGEDAPYLTVDNCLFGSSITRYGVYVAGNATRGFIGLDGGNMFRAVPNIGIYVTGAAGLGGVINNKFGLVSDTQGYAISFTNAGASGAIVSGNKAAYGITAMANNPFRDLGANHWIENYRQGLTVSPDVV
jgi:hypothetical protein